MIGHPRSDDSSFCRRQAGCLLPDGPPEEHAAVLQVPGGYDQLRRTDDLFDEGVSAVFGIRRGEADLQAVRFDASRFAAEQAQEWLLALGLEPIDFQAASGG
jgi:hypothetical protein